MVKPQREDPRWHVVAEAISRLRENPGDDVAVQAIADLIGLPLHTTEQVILDMRDARLLETDAGMGERPTVVEGH